jgi:hypothetical protein
MILPTVARLLPRLATRTVLAPNVHTSLQTRRALLSTSYPRFYAAATAAKTKETASKKTTKAKTMKPKAKKVIEKKPVVKKVKKTKAKKPESQYYDFVLYCYTFRILMFSTSYHSQGFR